MKLYKSTWYPERKSEFEVKDKTVVDILTMPERSSINRGYYDEDFERQENLKIHGCSLFPSLRQSSQSYRVRVPGNL